MARGAGRSATSPPTIDQEYDRMTSRRDFLAATLAAASLAALPAHARAQTEGAQAGREARDPRARRHRLPRPALRRGRAREGPQAHAVQSRQDQSRRDSRRGIQGHRTTARRSQERHEGARDAPQVGRGARHLGLRAGGCHAFVEAARQARRAVPAGVDHLGVREDGQAGHGRERAARATGRSERHGSHRRDLRRPEGAVREGRGSGNARARARSCARA